MDNLMIAGKAFYKMVSVFLMAAGVFGCVSVGMYFKTMSSIEHAQMMQYKQTKVGLYNFMIELKSLDSKKVDELLEKYNVK